MLSGHYNKIVPSLQNENHFFYGACLGWRYGIFVQDLYIMLADKIKQQA